MAAARGFATPLNARLLRRADVAFVNGKNGMVLEVRGKKRRPLAELIVKCCCSDIRRVSGSGKSVEKFEDRRFDPNKSSNYGGRAPAMPFPSSNQSCKRMSANKIGSG